MELQQETEKDFVLSSKDIKIQLRNLSYYVRGNKGKNKTFLKPILQNINAEFSSGHLIAILGPSGAGKSSLLNILSGFRGNNIRGSILLNEQEQNRKQLRSLSCYIPQEFDMHPLLTTKETLMTAANLKLSSKIGVDKKNTMVNETILLLGLNKVTNNFVGRLSGGERKRLSIGIELLTNPPVMLFDEPTSGLDSSSSYQVITHLKSLAQAGRIIICSIHQPSSRIFEMFDDVFLLGEGQCFYSGTVRDMTTIFEESGFPCPRFYNRADFAIEVISGERGDNFTDLIKMPCNNKETQIQVEQDEEEKAEISYEHSSMLPMQLYRSFRKSTTRFRQERVSRSSNGYAVNVFSQFFILLKRSFLCNIRDLHLAWLRVSAHIAVALLLGVMYYGIGNEASRTSSNVAFVFFFIMFLFYSNAMPTIITFPVEAAVFHREYLNNWYSLTAYYSSKLIADIPLQILCPTLFLCSGYFLTFQPYDGSRLLLLWVLCLLVTILAQTMGIVIGAAFDIKLGIFLVPALSIPMILFSGFFMKLKDFPWYLEWLTYVSYFRYAFEGAMQCVYGYNRKDLVCSVPYCHFKSSLKILEEFGMEEAEYRYDIIGLLAWIIMLQVAFYLVLKFRIRIS